MRLGPRFFRWHRWLAYAVALQVLAWVLGGVLFAWLPFQAWVKGNNWVQTKPQQALPAGWAQVLATGTTAVAEPPLAVQSFATAAGPAWRLRSARGDQWLAASGGALPAPDAAAVARFAQGLYSGPGQPLPVQKLVEVPRRLGLVRELGARKGPVWLAPFDDALKTRLYVDATSGELLAVRTEAWVLYDFFWRLHVMDYSDGEDFNNPLLRGFALAALALVLTGSVLVVLALARAWRRRRVHQAQAAASGA